MGDKPSSVEKGTKVDVYRNLNSGCLSVKSRETENYGIVIAHVDSIVLENVEFVVRDKGRKRAVREEKRNVHAFARGIVSKDKLNKYDSKVIYNPFKYKKFVTKENNKKVKRATMARIDDEGVKAKGVKYF